MPEPIRSFMDQVDEQVKKNRGKWNDRDKTASWFIFIAIEQLGQLAKAVIEGDMAKAATEVIHTVAILFEVWERI